MFKSVIPIEYWLLLPCEPTRRPWRRRRRRWKHRHRQQRPIWWKQKDNNNNNKEKQRGFLKKWLFTWIDRLVSPAGCGGLSRCDWQRITSIVPHRQLHTTLYLKWDRIWHWFYLAADLLNKNRYFSSFFKSRVTAYEGVVTAWKHQYEYWPDSSITDEIRLHF